MLHVWCSVGMQLSHVVAFEDSKQKGNAKKTDCKKRRLDSQAQEAVPEEAIKKSGKGKGHTPPAAASVPKKVVEKPTAQSEGKPEPTTNLVNAKPSTASVNKEPTTAVAKEEPTALAKEEPTTPAPAAARGVLEAEPCEVKEESLNKGETKEWAWNEDRGWGYWYGREGWGWGGYSCDGNWKWDHVQPADQRLGHAESKESLASAPRSIPPETPEPLIRKGSSLDSELLAAFSRLDTQDRHRSPAMAKVASTLEQQFESACTPDKTSKDAPTPSTSPGKSPNTSTSVANTQDSATSSPSKNPGDPDSKEKDTKGVNNEATKEATAAPTPDEGKTGEDADAKLEALAKRKKAAHAKYMRYWRSVHGVELGQNMSTVV